MPAKKEISLLPEEENQNSFLAKTLRWLSTVGRFVIVFTELIVISAFLSRFWLDRKNSDLSEISRQQKAILHSTQEFESQYSLLQQKLTVIKKQLSLQPDIKNKVQSLAQSTPSDLVYRSLDLVQDEKTDKMTATLSIYSQTESSLVDFITNIILNPDIETVDIQKISKPPKENKYLTDLYLIFTQSPVN